jgi:hypothetical protein
LLQIGILLDDCRGSQSTSCVEGEWQTKSTDESPRHDLFAASSAASYHDGSGAACVCFEHGDDGTPVLESTIEIGHVESYEPGQFYRRELPCILAVLQPQALAESVDDMNFEMALVQMSVTGGDKRRNLARAEALIAQAAAHGSCLVVLPEAMDLGWTLMICADGFAKDRVLSRALCYMGADILLSPSVWAVPAESIPQGLVGQLSHRRPVGLPGIPPSWPAV